MNALKILKWMALDVLKGIAAGIIALVGLVAGGMLTGLVGLPAVVVPSYIDMNLVLPLTLVSYVIMAILLGECFRRLFAAYWPRALAVFLCHYILYYLLNLLDGLLYSPFPNMTTGLFTDLFPALFAALLVALLWQPQAGKVPALSLGDLLHRVSKVDGIAWRLALAWLCYPPLYYLMGLVVAPFTKSYYADPSHALGLALPSVPAIWAMQVLRGALFLLAVLPLLLSWRGSRRGLWLWMGTLIFAQIAIQVILQATWLPAAVRIPHSLELLADSFVQAFLYSRILYPARERPAAAHLAAQHSH